MSSNIAPSLAASHTGHDYGHGLGATAGGSDPGLLAASICPLSKCAIAVCLQAQILWQDGFNQVAPFELLATLPALDRQQLAERRERSQVRGRNWTSAFVSIDIDRLICAHGMK